jgi:Arc/MetJ-type ribon-helix-helix transcriptional regulator
MKNYDCRIALRLPNKERLKAEQLIQERKFKNLSEVTRAALQQFLDSE